MQSGQSLRHLDAADMIDAAAFLLVQQAAWAGFAGDPVDTVEKIIGGEGSLDLDTGLPLQVTQWAAPADG